MENIVAATSTGMPAINGNTAAGAGGATIADGLFGALVANELTGETAPGGKTQKTSTGDDSQGMPMLMAALMQYGTLFGMLPVQGGTVPQTQDVAAQTDTVTAQAPAGAQPRQIAARQGSQGGLVSLMAARLMANSQNTTVAGTPADTAAAGGAGQARPAQGAQEFLSLLQTMGAAEGRGSETNPVSQTTSQTEQTAPAQAAPAQAAQNGLEALEEIKRLFVSLIDAGQETGPAQQTAAETLQTASTVQETAKNLPAGKAAALPQTHAAAQTLQGLLDAIAPQDTEDAAQSGAQANAGQDAADVADKGPGPAKLPGKAETLPAAKQETAAEAKKEPVGFGETYRAAHSQTAQAPHLPAQDGKTAAAHKTNTAEAFDSIVEKISSMQNSSLKEMEISLKPDFLGKVVIKLSMGDDGGLVAKIAASNPKVQDAFMSQAASLQSSLAEQGLKDVRVVVTSSAVADTALQQQAAGGGQSRREQEKRHNPVVVSALGGATAAGQPLLAYEQAYTTGSVNRLA